MPMKMPISTTAASRALEHRGPREEEDALDVEDDEQERVDVVADLRLAPALADRVHAALVGGELAGSGGGATARGR